MKTNTMTRILFASLIYGVLATVGAVPKPETLPHKAAVLPEKHAGISISAFEKNYLSSISEVATGSMYNGKSLHAMVVRNVEFGIFGAKNVTVGFNLQQEATKGDVEFRIDGENGQLISKLKMDAATASATVTPVKGYHDLYISYSANIKGNLSWFQFEVAGPNPGDFYVLTSLQNGQAIGAAALTVNAHAGVKPYAYGVHQMFRFTKTLFGSYYITNRKTEFNLDTKPDQLFADDAYLYQNKANSILSQEWYIDPAGGGTVKIISRANGRCVSIWSKDNLLVQQPCRNQTHQRWYFMPVC